MSERLCLRWNDFRENLINSIGSLRDESDFSDLTLVASDGMLVETHKMVLSMASPIFQNILRGCKQGNPMIFMRGVKSEDLSSILDFIYCGKTYVSQENLVSFLATAHDLQLKGLVGIGDDEEQGMAEKPHSSQFPKLENPIQKRETNVFVSALTPRPFELKLAKIESETEGSHGTIASDMSGDMQKLDEKLNSMMEKTSRRNSDGRPIYVCKLCGKEGKNQHIKYHIEYKHLEGVSIPCGLCGMTFRLGNIIDTHL